MANGSITQRLGGENTLEFVVLGWVERLQKDPKLAPYFSHYNTKSMELLQRQVLDAIFTKTLSGDDDDSFLLLRYYSLIERGFNATHFDTTVDHLVGAMGDAWVDDKVVKELAAMVRPYRRVFVEDKQAMKKTSKKSKSSSKSSGEKSLLRLIPIKSLYRHATDTTPTSSNAQRKEVSIPATAAVKQRNPNPARDELDDILDMYNEVLAM